MEIEYSNNKFLISGYKDDDNSYVLRVDTIATSSEQIFFAKTQMFKNVLMLLKLLNFLMAKPFTKLKTK